MPIRRALALIPLVSLLTLPLSAQTPSPSPLVDRIGARGYLQVEAPSYSKLPLRQKLVAYHLYRAAVQLDPIFYDQMSAYGLTAKRLLGAMVERPERLPEGARAAIIPLFDPKFQSLLAAEKKRRNLAIVAVHSHPTQGVAGSSFAVVTPWEIARPVSFRPSGAL